MNSLHLLIFISSRNMNILMFIDMVHFPNELQNCLVRPFYSGWLMSMPLRKDFSLVGMVHLDQEKLSPVLNVDSTSRRRYPLLETLSTSKTVDTPSLTRGPINMSLSPTLLQKGCQNTFQKQLKKPLQFLAQSQRNTSTQTQNPNN